MSNLHQFNPGRKSWKIYGNTLTSISGDDLTISPYDGKDLILEASGNGSILFKENGITYTMADLSNVASGGEITYDSAGITPGIDASFQNVDISGTLKMNNIQSIQDISSGLGEIDVSFVNNTLSIDAKNMLYATKYFNYTSNIDISNLDVTNFQNNAQIVINLDNSGTVVFRGSNNGGINNSKINFVYDISLNNTDSILTLTKLNENIFLMVSEFK